MSNLSEALISAFQFYQAGNLPQAERICQQIRQQQPNSTEALDLLGRMAHQVGKLEEAIAYYQQLIALMPDYAEIYYRLGSALQSKGQLAEAIAYYQHAIALKPNYCDAYYDLGNALQEQGNLNAAIEHYQQAITLNPNDAQARGNLANALLEQGQIEAAIVHYQQVLALSPNLPGIYYNLGNAYMLQSQLESAITCFRWALAVDPNYGDAYLQLSKALHASGQLAEAIFYYQQAIFFQPNSPDAPYNLGNALLKQGRFEEAIIRYQQALSIEPHCLNAYVGISSALFPQNQFEEALTCLQQALILNPDHPEANYNLAVALANQNKIDEAIAYFQKAFQLKSALVEAYWHSQLILPILYDTQEQIRVWRQRFCWGLHNLIQQTALDTSVGRNHALSSLGETAFNFYLGYQGFNDRGLQRRYGNFVHRVVAAHYPQWTQPLPMPPLSNANKIRVGYLSAYFKGHTVGKLTFGWLKNGDRQSFEIYSYHIGNKGDFLTEQFRSCSDSFHHIYGNLEEVCKQILSDKLHILVFTDIGMAPQTTLIAALRLAPVQCMFWGHPITSGLPTIDYFLSNELMEPEKAQSHYCETLVCLPNISICYEKPTIPEPTKTRSDFQFREDSILYLSCQSLFKYLPQFDYIFAKIAQRVPQAQFAFIASHTPSITAQFQARLQRAFANLGLKSKHYCVIVPKQDWVSYLNLNLVSNIFLDTFSWSGGNTTLEAIACGLPVVTCPGKLMRSRHAYGILKMMGVTETIAQDEAEYVEIAVRLGLDADWRQEIVRKIEERHSWLYDDKTCVTALEDFYQKVVLSQLGTDGSVKKTSSDEG
jgi:predicted O-linked N-acetylglucosamine transferase (SPINDLY family)